MRALKNCLLVGLGLLSLGMGAIGLFLPVWPTTPFVLLAIGCFSSTPRLRAWVLKVPFFREHVENYEHRTGLSHKTLRLSLIWLWGMLLLSIMLLQKGWLALLLLLIGVAVTCHLLWMAKPRKVKTERGD